MPKVIELSDFSQTPTTGAALTDEYYGSIQELTVALYGVALAGQRSGYPDACSEVIHGMVRLLTAQNQIVHQRLKGSL